MKKSTIALPLILIGCMLAAAGVALLSPPTEAEAEPVVKKQAEKIMKNPVTVEEMESRNKKEESRNIEVAEAVIATIIPTPTAEPTPSPTPEITPTPEPVITEEAVLVMEEPVLATEAVNEQEEPPVYVDVETQEEMPTPADEFAYQDETPIGTFMITWYTRESIGYDAPGASGLGCIPGYTCAVPEYWMLGHTIRINGYGYRMATDISPDGIVDLYELENSSIPSYGVDYQECFIVG